MATPTTLERLSYGGPDGALASGLHRQVIQGVGATRQLLPKESGALCLFDRTAGNIYTLPTPVEGMTFDFLVAVSVTASDVHKIITKTIASEFLLGAVTMVTIATASPAGFSANGTTIVASSMTATTAGGLIGGALRFTAISATQWGVSGVLVGSGTIVTPFATS